MHLDETIHRHHYAHRLVLMVIMVQDKGMQEKRSNGSLGSETDCEDAVL